MQIFLPNAKGHLEKYNLVGTPIPNTKMQRDPCRVVFSAAHVVADPFSANDPYGLASVDWDATMKFRHHLADLGLGIAEAMDTAQRGMGLDWTGALELIKRTKSELPDAMVANGVGTDHLDLATVSKLEDVVVAYRQQLEAVQKIGARVILMASRALAKVAQSRDDYIAVYGKILSECDHPVILHWLGDMFDPALSGYWGGNDFDDALETVLTIINSHQTKVDGIKISLLDKDKEILMRRRLPAGVKMYTGDDFNYPELIEGDDKGFSHALLGIFDPLAAAAAHAVNKLGSGDVVSFRQTLDPTVPLARRIFRSPTQHYKTGVVFLAWLNGFQDHFIMLNGAQAARPLPDFVEIFKMADECGVLQNPDYAIKQMLKLLAFYGVN
jgi:hypothetical protein